MTRHQLLAWQFNKKEAWACYNFYGFIALLAMLMKARPKDTYMYLLWRSTDYMIKYQWQHLHRFPTASRVGVGAPRTAQDLMNQEDTRDHQGQPRNSHPTTEMNASARRNQYNRRYSKESRVFTNPIQFNLIIYSGLSHAKLGHLFLKDSSVAHYHLIAQCWITFSERQSRMARIKNRFLENLISFLQGIFNMSEINGSPCHYRH